MSLPTRTGSAGINWILARDVWLHRVAWPLAVAVIGALAWIRTLTGAEFAFASLALFPVMLIAWAAGRNAGFGMALVACTAWVVGDIASGKHAWTSWLPWMNGAIRLITYSLVAVMAAKVHDQFVVERERARRDELTGLANRRHFINAANIEVQRSRRYARPLAVVCLDLDRFKRLNDNHGHALGDEALRATATALHGLARSSDVVARMGGDEFVILLPEVDRAAATEVAHRISATVNAALARFPEVSASVGAAWFGDHAPTLPAMLEAADAAMYRAKQQGNGCVVIEDRSASQNPR